MLVSVLDEISNATECSFSCHFSQTLKPGAGNYGQPENRQQQGAQRTFPSCEILQPAGFSRAVSTKHRKIYLTLTQDWNHGGLRLENLGPTETKGRDCSRS